MPRMLCLLLLLGFICDHAIAADALVDGPRDGKYLIMSYGATSSPPLVLGYFVLAGGTYKAYLNGDKLTGEGRYTYKAAATPTEKSAGAVAWETGPYMGVWGGDFSIDRGGKTHKIRLKRTTIGTNSTD